MAGLLSWGAVLASLVYSGIVINSIIAKYGIVLYTFHPIAGCLLLVFATLGVVSSQRPRKEKGKHKDLINQHAFFMILGLLSALGCFYAIYQNKENNGYSHLKSNHGIAGAAVVAMWLCTQTSGALSWFFPKLVAKGGADLKRIYAIHGVFGYVVATGVLAAHVLALQSGYQGVPKGTPQWYVLAASLALIGLGLLSGLHPRALLAPILKGKAKVKTA